VLVGLDRVTDAGLRDWTTQGITAVVVPVDETMPASKLALIAAAVKRSGLAFHVWIEVARHPALAMAHPEWMAAPGGHHDDWRRLFPDAPKAGVGHVVKAWPWVPIGYAPAYDAQIARVTKIVADLPEPWEGVFLNDLQAGPSSCGCGNAQCRWALDYGSPSTAPLTPGDDAAARFVAAIAASQPAKSVTPVWVTECEFVDQKDAAPSTGHCGGVFCARNACWDRYRRAWDPLVASTHGPIALALWSEAFGRDPAAWPETALKLFSDPPKGGAALPKERALVVVPAWETGKHDLLEARSKAARLSDRWVVALERVEQAWEPKVVKVPRR
jgi:hypothetical protein